MLITYPHIESEDTRYAYAVGRVRALETKLLSPHKIARLFEADSGDELLRNLQDTDYSQWLTNPRDYESMIKNARRELYKLLDKLILNRDLIELLKLKYDYYNAKVLLKGSITEKDVSGLLSDFGNIKKQEMSSIFQEERYDKFPYGLSQAIPEAISVYYLNKDPRFLDIIPDKFYYSYLLGQNYNKRVKNVFLKTLIKIEADLINIKTLLRIKWLKEERSLFTKVFISGAWIELSRLLDSFEEPIEGIPRHFEYTPYYGILNDGIEFLQSKNSFSRLEKLCENHFMEFCKTTKYLSFGVEPVIAYFYAKESELRVLRLMFVGKLNKVPDELIKERLPEPY